MWLSEIKGTIAQLRAFTNVPGFLPEKFCEFPPSNLLALDKSCYLRGLP